MRAAGLTSERGSATVTALGLALILIAAASLAATLGQVVLLRQLAGSAADLAAFSAASSLLTGSAVSEACDVASRVAVPQGAEVERCEIEGQVAVVEVRRMAPSWLGRVLSAAGSPDGAVHADARAGPSW